MKNITSVQFKRITALLAILFFTILLEPQAESAIPKVMSYQGVLKNSAGSLLSGTYSMQFKIYSASTGGSALWTETQSSISVSSGRFSVQLGSVTPLGLDFSQDYWLSIKVGSDAEMTPRIRLTSVGYAYRAQEVVNGFTQAQHDAMSHKNIEGVKDNAALIAKTNFKLDAITMASANSLGDMIIDLFNDPTGIHGPSSTNYVWRNSPDLDIRAVLSGGGIDSYTTVALHANGTNGATTFTDSSSRANGVSVFGDAKLDTAQKKFGTASAKLDGAGDYLSVPASFNFDSENLDWTLDFNVRFNSVSSPAVFLSRYLDSNYNWRIGWETSNNLKISQSFGGANDVNVSFPWTPVAGVWYHIAFVRSGSNYLCFVNGVQVGSTVNQPSYIRNFGSTCYIGTWNNSSFLNGWLDEFRFSRGIARWTAAFSVPLAEYTSSAPSGTADVRSIAFSEPFVPREAMIIAQETLNTGTITYYISRDNGATWTIAPKETMVNISSQPSGSQVRWRAVISGNAELESVAVAL